MNMKKKTYFNLVFFGVGTFLIILLSAIVFVNFTRDARMFDKPVAKVEKDTSVKQPDTKQDNKNGGEKTLNVSEITGKAEETAKKQPSSTPTQVKKIKVEVINYTDIKGLAERIRTTLEKSGFEVSAGNEKTNDTVTTAIINRNDKNAAMEVKKVLKAGQILNEYVQDSRYDVTVVIGDDYNP